MAFEENEYSKIFPNEEFGYWEVELFKPAKDESGNVIKDKKGINSSTNLLQIH